MSKLAISAIAETRRSKSTPETIRTSDLLILVNQHITCPRGPQQPWIPSTTQFIAGHFRGNGLVGLLYQTAIAHSLTEPGTVYADPRELWNFAIFLDPHESGSRLVHQGSTAKTIPSEVRRLYAEGCLKPDALHEKMQCASFTESAMLAVGSPFVTPSLPFFGVC